ncbi:MAG: alpha/beta hydrolase [Lachnospiraceae bacterium]|nr:alpha/beta hydrolase [Lachnospiraceae bacterium]
MRKNIFTKRLVKRVAIVIACLVVGFAVVGSWFIGGMVADGILHQNEDKDTHYNSIMQLEEWGYDTEGFEKTYSKTEISATAEDGNVVPANFYAGKNDEIVVLVHGAGGDRACMYPLAEKYLEEGYGVISIDQRGSGSNPDDEVTFGIKERLDVEAMVAYAREELGADKVIVHGQSMGAQTAALYASNVSTGSVETADAVVCDSPVPGMESLLKDMFGDGDRESFGAIYYTTVGKIYMQLVNHMSFDEADTIEVVKNDNIPTMVIVSTEDELCMADEVKEVYDNIGCKDKAIMYVESEHIKGVIDDPNGYMEGVNSFLTGLGL